jgi:hypothetical protein
MKPFCGSSLAGRFIFILSLGFLLTIAGTTSARAGEPTGEIGPMNPTMFECVEEDGSTITLDTIQDIINNDSTTGTSSCTDNFKGVSDFGFDTTDAVLFRGYLSKLEDECKDKGGHLQPLAKTRIEGVVYEFHPVDPANPTTSEWEGVRSRDVPVIARGISFEIVWGTEKDGSFFFDHLGAGPIVLSMGLPGDAHPINPDLVVKSTGQQESIPVLLGFYRGDVAPNISQLRPVDGNTLPFAAQEDIVLANDCGLPMPNVGGSLPADQPLLLTILAAVVLAVLPLGGFLTLRRNRSSL